MSSDLEVLAREDLNLIERVVDAREALESASLDSLIAVRAWCDAVAVAAKQRALTEVALEASETRARAEFRLGRLLRSGAGAGMRIPQRDWLAELAELTPEQFETTLKDMRSRRQGDQILGFRPDTVLRNASRLFSEDVEPGIRRDFRGLYNGRESLQEARAVLADNQEQEDRWDAFRERWDRKVERRKPDHVLIEAAVTRARRLAQSVEDLSDWAVANQKVMDHLTEAAGLLKQTEEALHLALREAVLADG